MNGLLICYRNINLLLIYGFMMILGVAWHDAKLMAAGSVDGFSSSSALLTEISAEETDAADSRKESDHLGETSTQLGAADANAEEDDLWDDSSHNHGFLSMMIPEGMELPKEDGQPCILQKAELVRVSFKTLKTTEKVVTISLASPIAGCSSTEFVVSFADQGPIQNFLGSLAFKAEANETASRESKTGLSTPSADDLSANNFHKEVTGSPEPLIQPDSGVKPTYVFPLAQAPLLPFTNGGREFGASRRYGARLHAGVDLVEYAGQAVYAITDGVILNFAYFYEGTYVITVDHKNFVIRYGEVKKMYGNLDVNHKVKGGQKVGVVGYLWSGSSMLHLEKYTGKLVGPFLVTSAYPYQRRRDLVDPTRFVRSLEGSWPNPSSS